MGRKPNLAKSEEITLSLNPRTVWYVDRLIEAGALWQQPLAGG